MAEQALVHTLETLSQNKLTPELVYRYLQLKNESDHEISGEKLCFNISGQSFVISKSLLLKHSTSNLSSIDHLSQFWNEDLKAFYFDRDPVLFNAVLNIYRYNMIHIPPGYNESMFKNEMEFWNIPGEQLDEDEEYKEIEDEFIWIEDRYDFPKEDASMWSYFRYNTWCFIADPKGPHTRHKKLALAYTALTITFIIVYMILFGLSTRTEHRRVVTSEQSNTSLDESFDCTIAIDCLAASRPAQWLDVCLLSLMSFFLFDTFLRILFCPDHLRYFKSVINWIDLITSLCVVILMVFRNDWLQVTTDEKAHAILTLTLYCFQALRIFKVFQFATVLDGLMVILLTIKASAHELIVLMTYIIISIFTFATLVFFAEVVSGTDSGINDITIGYWWAIVTMTTVGYGDVVPKTSAGQVIGGITVITGLLMTALPVAVIGGNFNKYWEHNKKRRSRLQKKKKLEAKNNNQLIADSSTKNNDSA